MRGIYRWLFNTRKFFSFPWASCIDLFLPSCFSSSDERRKERSRQIGEEENLWDREGDGRRSSPEDGRTRKSSGRTGETTERTKEARERTRKNEKERFTKERHLCSLLLVDACLHGTQCKNRGHWIAVRSALQMRACAGLLD